MVRLRPKIPRNAPLPTRVPAILRTRSRKPRESSLIRPTTPRLWNAKRRIVTSRGLSEADYSHYLEHHRSSPDFYRTRVSPDVTAYLDANPWLLSKTAWAIRQRLALLKNPSAFFSRSHNVPASARSQIYFPDFTVKFIRTPNSPPHYATFYVPIWFNKLDLKDYLSSLYNVEVTSLTSYVAPQPIRRGEPTPYNRRGSLERAPPRKKMIVKLVEPFIWPAETTDFSEWEKEDYWHRARSSVDIQRENGNWAKTNADRRHRAAVAQQAKELLQGKREWSPTWRQLPAVERVLRGVADVQPSPRELRRRVEVKGSVEEGRPMMRQIQTAARRKELPVVDEVLVKEMEELRV